MHSKGFAHTDIKPENILVQHMDNPKQGIKLIDLGGTYPREKFGDQCIQTRQFRAPEVVLGREWNEKVDIWSVGCTLFEMVTGDVLFPAHDPRTHLAMIERAVGEFPEYMSSDNSNFDDGAVKFPSNGMSQETIDTIVQVLPLKRCVERRIYSFLRLMLRICPEERASAQQIVDKFSRWHKRGLL
jgi:serine/threonine protein kinase